MCFNELGNTVTNREEFAICAVFEIKAFLSVAADSKCFWQIQLTKMHKLSALPCLLIPTLTAGSDCISDVHHSTYFTVLMLIR